MAIKNTYGGKKWWQPLYHSLPHHNLCHKLIHQLLSPSSLSSEQDTNKDWGLAMGGKTGIFTPM